MSEKTILEDSRNFALEFARKPYALFSYHGAMEKAGMIQGRKRADAMVQGILSLVAERGVFAADTSTLRHERDALREGIQKEIDFWDISESEVADRLRVLLMGPPPSAQPVRPVTPEEKASSECPGCGEAKIAGQELCEDCWTMAHHPEMAGRDVPPQPVPETLGKVQVLKKGRWVPLPPLHEIDSRPEMQPLEKLLEDLWEYTWGKDIPSPQTPEYREHHEAILGILKRIKLVSEALGQVRVRSAKVSGGASVQAFFTTTEGCAQMVAAIQQYLAYLVKDHAPKTRENWLDWQEPEVAWQVRKWAKDLLKSAKAEYYDDETTCPLCQG